MCKRKDYVQSEENIKWRDCKAVKDRETHRSEPGHVNSKLWTGMFNFSWTQHLFLYTIIFYQPFWLTPPRIHMPVLFTVTVCEWAYWKSRVETDDLHYKTNCSQVKHMAPEFTAVLWPCSCHSLLLHRCQMSHIMTGGIGLTASSLNGDIKMLCCSLYPSSSWETVWRRQNPG